MQKLPKNLAQSEEARLWKQQGSKDFARRLGKVADVLPGKAAKSELAEALGVKTGSLYSILHGRCTYALFVTKIAPAELARLRRRQNRALNPSDQLLTDEQWQNLALIEFIQKYATHLLDSEAPLQSSFRPQYRLDDTYEVAQELVEDVCSTIESLSGIARDTRKSFNHRGMESLLRSLPFPAGFLKIEATPSVICCNQRLFSFLGVNSEALVGKPLANLFEIALRLVPAKLAESTVKAFEYKIGKRRVMNSETRPLCFQFYVDNTKREGSDRGIFRTTLIVLPLTFGRPDITIFGYHLKEAQAGSSPD